MRAGWPLLEVGHRKHLPSLRGKGGVGIVDRYKAPEKRRAGEQAMRLGAMAGSAGAAARRSFTGARPLFPPLLPAPHSVGAQAMVRAVYCTIGKSKPDPKRGGSKKAAWRSRNTSAAPWVYGAEVVVCCGLWGRGGGAVSCADAAAEGLARGCPPAGQSGPDRPALWPPRVMPPTPIVSLPVIGPSQARHHQIAEGYRIATADCRTAFGSPQAVGSAHVGSPQAICRGRPSVAACHRAVAGDEVTLSWHDISGRGKPPGLDARSGRSKKSRVAAGQGAASGHGIFACHRFVATKSCKAVGPQEAAGYRVARGLGVAGGHLAS